MRTLVTGGAGFIGSHLANFLKRHGHFVRVADTRSQSECYLPLEIDEYMQCDMRNREEAVTACKGMNEIYNLAATMGGIGFISGGHDAEIMRDNALIHLNMLEAVRLTGIPQILYSSSACIYPRFLQGTSTARQLKESDAIPALPDNFYGWEKLFSEQLYESYRRDYGVSVRIARLHNIYGPSTTFSGGREKSPAAICRKVAEANDKGTITIWGDGNQRRSYMYVSDCIEALVRLMHSDYYLPMNVGTPKSISINQLTALIMKIAGKTLKVKHDLSKPQGVRGRNCNISLMRKTLGWAPKVTYECGMEKLYKWVEKQIGEKQSAPTTV